MKIRYRIAWILGLGFLLASALFPPRSFVNTTYNGGTNAPRSFIGNPAIGKVEMGDNHHEIPVEIDAPRMFAEWMAIIAATGLLLVLSHRGQSKPLDRPRTAWDDFLDAINW